MELQKTTYLNVELKSFYFNEFIVCGVPIPQYANGTNFTLMFSDAESYLNYLNTLRLILKDLQQADLKKRNYEIQRSRYFIKSVMLIIKNQYAKKYNHTMIQNEN